MDANTVSAVCAVYPSTVQHVVYYDLQTGKPAMQADIYTRNDPELGVSHTYLYSDGGAFAWSEGGGYGRHGENGQLYVARCIGSFYEDKMRQIGAQNLGEFGDGQTITAEEVAADGKLHVTTVGPVPEGGAYGDASTSDQTLVARYTIDPETLIMESCDAFVRDAEGVERQALASTLERDPTLVLPFDIAPIREPEATREVCVVLDPGTDAETEQVFIAPLDIVMYLYAPDGYALFDDAACTVPMSSAEPDENGHYPETLTVYCAMQP